MKTNMLKKSLNAPMKSAQMVKKIVRKKFAVTRSVATKTSAIRTSSFASNVGCSKKKI